jgi:hypothetical protein
LDPVPSLNALKKRKFLCEYCKSIEKFVSETQMLYAVLVKHHTVKTCPRNRMSAQDCPDVASRNKTPNINIYS